MGKDSAKQPAGRRQVVKFTFFQVDPAWRRLSLEERGCASDEFCRVVDSCGDRLLTRSYSLIGMRGDADFLLWQIGDRLEDIQRLTTQLFSTAIGPYLSIPYSYLALTRRSIYLTRDEPEAAEARTVIRPTNSKYFFVYPFVKTRAWYKLPKATRQKMMDDHIAVGRKYPSVKLNTTYSYGLDDQEFVVAFETDEPSDFLDLVMELRETEASQYTLRDTPTLTCIAMPLPEVLESLCAPDETRQSEEPTAGTDDWVKVADLSELPDDTRKVVYVRGEQVALFNLGGQLFAVANRCPHANGPISEGEVEGTTVTCLWHGSRFDLASGEPLRPPATRPLPTYAVQVREGAVFVAPRPTATQPADTELGAERLLQ